MIGISTISGHWVALVAAIVLTAISQVLLRVGAKETVSAQTAPLLNFKILFSYILFFFVVLLMIYSMQEISLRTASALNSVTYIIIPLLAHKVVKDPISLRIMLGSLIIVIGIVVFFI